MLPKPRRQHHPQVVRPSKQLLLYPISLGAVLRLRPSGMVVSSRGRQAAEHLVEEIVVHAAIAIAVAWGGETTTSDPGTGARRDNHL